MGSCINTLVSSTNSLVGPTLRGRLLAATLGLRLADLLLLGVLARPWRVAVLVLVEDVLALGMDSSSASSSGISPPPRSNRSRTWGFSGTGLSMARVADFRLEEALRAGVLNSSSRSRADR